MSYNIVQADVCHAYQLLKKGGVKEENIVVFMYDDIAKNEENPRPGVIINSPNGEDVYNGVPKVIFSAFFRVLAAVYGLLKRSCDMVVAGLHWR